MSRRPAASRTLYCPLDAKEIALIERMRDAVSSPPNQLTDANLVRCALGAWAVFLKLEFDDEFSLRTERSRRRQALEAKLARPD